MGRAPFVKKQGMENTKDIIRGDMYRPPYNNNEDPARLSR